MLGLGAFAARGTFHIWVFPHWRATRSAASSAMEKREYSTLIGAGLLAGAAATLCMSAAMILSKKLGIQGEHPPKKIVAAALEAAGDDQAEEPKVRRLASVAHMGFGIGTGAAFAATRNHLPLKNLPVVQGVLYALVIWAVSYRGWVPALNIMPHAEQDRPGRVRTMVTAHAIYGSVLGALLDAFQKYRPGRKPTRPGLKRFLPISTTP